MGFSRDECYLHYSFSVCVDDILCKLCQSNLGYYVGCLCLDFLMYADDLVLITSSLIMLQKMTIICDEEADNIDIWSCVLINFLISHVHIC